MIIIVIRSWFSQILDFNTYMYSKHNEMYTDSEACDVGMHVCFIALPLSHAYTCTWIFEINKISLSGF